MCCLLLPSRELKQELEAQQLREISKINPTSERIVQEKQLLEGAEPAESRLTRPIGAVKQRILEGAEPAESRLR